MARAWTGKTYGNAWLYKTLISWLKHIDIRVFYALSAWLVIPVTMVVSPGARVAYRYFRQRRGYGKWQAVRATYRNHCLFAQTVIDKFAMYAGHQFQLHIHGNDEYKPLLASPEAFVQLNAHVGCAEIVGYSYDLSQKRCNVLVYGGEKESVMAYRREAFSKMNMWIIPVGGASSHSDEILGALERGEIISVFADRLLNPNKYILSRLHGAPFKVARGPFSIAVTNGLRVIMCSAMKQSANTYDVYLTPLTYDKSLSRREQQQQLADAYTAELERLLQQYPLQWYNYFDAWQQ